MRKASAAVPLSKDQWAILFTASIIFATLLIFFRFGFLQGVITVITAMAFGNFMFEFITQYLSASTRSNADKPLPEDHAFPIITLLSPMYKEVNVLYRHIKAASEIDWPSDRLEHFLLIREEDVELLQALECTVLPPHMQILLIPPDYYGSKPAALEYALLHTNGMFYLILDAENVPSPQLLQLAYREWFHAPDRTKLAGVSAVPVVSNWHGSPVAKITGISLRLKIGNVFDRHIWSKLLTMHQGAEYAKHYLMITKGSLRLGLTPLPGNSVLFLTEAVRSVGGYDRFNKAEDADLAVALARGGFTITSVTCDTYEEAPKTFSGWFKQRRRWMDGFLQTFFSHSRHPREMIQELGFMNTVLFLHYFGIRPFLQLINPAVIGLTVLYGLTLFPQIQSLNPTVVTSLTLTLQEIYSPPAKIMGMFIMLIGTYHYFDTLIVACAHRKMWKSIPFMILAPIYWFAQSIAQMWAVKDFLTHAPWHLTEHEAEEAAETTAPAYSFSATPTGYSKAGD